MGLEIETFAPREGLALVRVYGEVDVGTAPRLKQELFRVLDEGRLKVIVNLSEVAYLDSTGLGVLISGFTRALKRGGDLRLVCVSEPILRILEVTRLTTVFDIYNNEEDALRHFG